MIESSGAISDAFHGMGREDIDVRCLGEGRPFVAELKSPLRRTLELEQLTNSINKAAENQIEVHGLRLSNRAEVSRIKETKAEKSYMIRFTSDHGLTDEEVTTRIQSLSGQVLAQQTPQRVSHRRADKIRNRKVVSIENILITDDEIQFDVRCESGTYVKELIHSDEGRTNPSVAALLETDCEVILLDVKDIHAD